ncbi:type III-B CRISPR module RAMP protein Cmr6 [Melioribacter sp. OK-6-Me]|uniref:type III-B CRISPR module RAMP protein Cmr6 n=1 Tax=unclassified Melioribacter TaxID=2627329 RepID=UPI003ED84860
MNKKNNEPKEILLLPVDTSNSIDKNLSQIDNFALKYNKFILGDINNKYKIDPKKINITINEKSLKNLLEEINLQQIKSAQAIFGPQNVIENKKELSDKIIVGLGNESVYETSMTLHYTYGFPYIPGQSLKGAVRSHVINYYFHKKEEEALTTSKTFCLLFGCPEKIKDQKTALAKEYKGSVVFFDAFPIYMDELCLKKDIINPHYGEYYEKKKPPADYLMPVPVSFLAIENTIFQFILAANNNELVQWQGKEVKLLDLAWNLTNEALTKSGVGAKTAVGYGYFKE